MTSAQLALTFATDTPPVPATPSRAMTARNSAVVDAGSHTRRTIGWRAPTTSSNQAILGTLTTLRDRSRAATRNDGFAKSAIDKLVSNIIGTGIKPMSTVADPDLRNAIHALWLQWTDHADADGLLDVYGQQAQAVRTWLEGGEAFGRLRDRLPNDGLPVPLQVQLLEPELCPHTHTLPSQRVRAGFQFDALGRRVGYYFHPSRPEQDDYDASQLRLIAATRVLHMYDPLRPGQLRGYPLLTQALIALHELAKYTDAVLVKQELANMFVGFIKRQPSVGGESSTIDPLTGLPVSTVNGQNVLQWEPGTLQELAEGEEMQFSEPPESTGYADFVRQVLFEIAAATGVPYEVLTGDMRGVNDRTVRVILNEFRRKLQTWQHQVVVHQWCRPIWNAWMDRAFLSGALPLPSSYAINPAEFRACKWVPQGWPYIHPVQDVQAAVSKIRGGLGSRAAAVSELGEDVEVIDAEQQADNARADEMGLKHDSDGRAAATSPGTAPTDPEPPEPQPAGAAA